MHKPNYQSLPETAADLVRKMARAGIPICGHVGSKPQQAALSGGYTSQGRTPEDADRARDDASTEEAPEAAEAGSASTGSASS